MIRLHNIMPVELAIRRELEYRRKLEILRKQNESDLIPLVIMERRPTPSARETKKRPRTSTYQQAPVLQSSLSCLPFPKLPSGLVCTVCRIAFATVFHLKQHSKTLAHTGKLFQMKKRGENTSNPFLCELCNSSCSSAFVMEQHLNGTRHIASLQEFEKVKRARALEAITANR